MAEDKKKEIAVIEITEEYMKDRLYEFRGKKVMLDSDLAEIYGYETKNFKRQVKNNIAKFEGDDFMFELNDEEVENLSRCKNFTLNMGRGSNIKYKPYVFTEQGVYMLMTVLRGDLAIKQSRALVKTFKKMKDYILENRDLIGQREILQISMETANNRIEINKINSDMISLEKQNTVEKSNFDFATIEGSECIEKEKRQNYHPFQCSGVPDLCCLCWRPARQHRDAL